MRKSLVFFTVTAATSARLPAAVQRYEPVPGGFAIANGGAQFSRPLYGWHGDDNEDRPKRSMMLAGDRPEVALKIAKGMRMGRRRVKAY